MKNKFLLVSLYPKKGSPATIFISGLILLFSNIFLSAQCDLLDLPGVPADITVEESYVKTTEQKVVYPSSGSEATFSTYEYARMEPTVLIEEVQHAITGESDQVMISSVSNPSEYFSDYVVPYSHVIVEPSDIYIYQNESIIGSYSRSQWSLDSVDLEDGPSNPSVEGESTPFPITALGGDLIQIDYGDLIYVIDTVQNFEIFNAVDSNGQTKSVKFIQRDPNDTLRSVPLFSTHYYKQSKRNGDCFYQVIDKKYSHYCRPESHDSSTVDLRSAEVEERSIRMDLMIYPNPASNFINIQYSSLKDQELNGATLEVISQTGQIIDTRKVNSSKIMQLNISGYPSGLYVIRILSENKTLVNKFVKP